MSDAEPQQPQEFAMSEPPAQDFISSKGGVIVAVIVALIVGFFIGESYERHSIANSAQNYLKLFGSALNSADSTVSPTPLPSPTESALSYDKDFALDSISFTTTSDGKPEAIGLVRNISDTTHSGFFTLAFPKSDGITPDFTLTGDAMDVAPGQAVTVTFDGDRGSLQGKTTMHFQVDSEM